MLEGMGQFFVLMLAQVVMTCVWVYTTQEEIIFTDRVAPMFAFTAGKSLTILIFYCFWICKADPTSVI